MQLSAISLGITRPAGIGLTQRALAILRKYGTDAHLWMPGVGVVNGITAGNFSDTAGTTAAIVDSTAGVGLVVDAGGGTINATQGTTAAKPILRQSSGRYSWQFDGTDDRLQLSAVPFQQADDHCVIAGANAVSATGNPRVFSVFSAGSAGIRLYLDSASSGYRAAWIDDANTQIYLGAGSNETNSVRVVSLRKADVAKSLRVNGSASGTTSFQSMGATTLVGSTIGANNAAAFFNGNIGPVIAIKGTVSAADLLTLEKWVGSLSGVTI